jgi:hypothetical protein
MVMWNLVGHGVKWAARGVMAFSETEAGKKTAELSGKAYRATRDATKDAINTYKENQQLKGDTNMDDFIAEEWFGNFAGIMTKQYQDHIRAIKTLGARLTALRSPVLTSRQALIDSYKQYEAGSKAEAQRLISAAIASADSGAVSPDASEWPIDGPEIGRGHACMWGAIARVLAHKQAESFAGQDATLSDSWFGAAFTIFLENDEGTMAGRALQEWAESRRLVGDEEGANTLFLGAMCVFRLIGNQQRLSLVGNRPSESGPVAMDSSFFLNRPATSQESQVLSSVLGARNTHKFFKAVG